MYVDTLLFLSLHLLRSLLVLKLMISSHYTRAVRRVAGGRVSLRSERLPAQIESPRPIARQGSYSFSVPLTPEGGRERELSEFSIVHTRGATLCLTRRVTRTIACICLLVGSTCTSRRDNESGKCLYLLVYCMFYREWQTSDPNKMRPVWFWYNNCNLDVCTVTVVVYSFNNFVS